MRDPRRALEPKVRRRPLLRGAHHVLNPLMPTWNLEQRSHLLQLASAYQRPEPHTDTNGRQ